MSAQLANLVRTLRRLDVREHSDGQLLRQFAEHGDEDAFALLVRRHGPFINGVCRRILRNVHDAEDAAQATFLVLARKAGAIAWQDSISGWLHEVALRVSLDARHALIRRRTREQQTERMPDKIFIAEKNSIDLADCLDVELNRLPAKFRSPLILCYLKGSTRDEAAEQLGWNVSLVKTRLEQGRNLLRDRLAKRGLTLGAVLSAALVTGSAEAAISAAQMAGLVALASSPQSASAASKMLATGVITTMWLRKIQSAACVIISLASLLIGIGIAVRVGFAETADSAEIKAPQRATTAAIAPKKKPLATFMHGDEVRDAVFASDGKQVITACFDGTFRRWDIATGKELDRWESTGINSAIAISRDGKIIAGGNNKGELLAWNADDGKEKFARLTRHGNVFSLNFSPDGKRVASANANGSVTLMNPETGANVLTIDAHRSRVWCVSFAPKEKWLVSGGEDGQVRLWNSDTGKHIRDFEGHSRNASSVCFSPDGTTLVSADLEDSIRKSNVVPEGLDDTIRIWDVATAKELKKIRTPLTHCVTYSPDGKSLVSGNRAGTIHVWNVADGKQKTSWQAHTGAAMFVQFHSDGQRVLSAGQDGAVHLWSLK